MPTNLTNNFDLNIRIRVVRLIPTENCACKEWPARGLANQKLPARDVLHVNFMPAFIFAIY